MSGNLTSSPIAILDSSEVDVELYKQPHLWQNPNWNKPKKELQFEMEEDE